MYKIKMVTGDSISLIEEDINKWIGIRTIVSQQLVFNELHREYVVSIIYKA